MAMLLRLLARWGTLATVFILGVGACDRDDGDGATPDDEERADEDEREAAGAGADEGAEDEAEGADRISSPFLWRVETPDGGGEGWLFGTMHLGVDAEAKLPDRVWEALEGSDVFAMEADLSSAMEHARAFMRQDDSTLREEIGEEAWETFADIVGPAQAQGLDRMRAPVAAVALIAEALPTTPPMDIVLHNRAEEADLELAYLEDTELQLDLFEEYFDAATLIRILEDYDEVRAATERGLAAYLEGDGETLEEDLVAPGYWEGAPEEVLEAFLYERNENWVPEIEALFERGTPFVAVGAGHLVGEQSVVDLLEDEGYEAERVSIE